MNSNQDTNVQFRTETIFTDVWEFLGKHWVAILGLVLLTLTIVSMYLITKPGWDRVAKGESFFLSKFEERDRIVQECLLSERYTRDECIILAGNKP